MSASLYFGGDAFVPTGTDLRAGPLRVLYEAGALRYVRLGETEVVRMIYAAVRDEKWGTVPARIQHEQIETGPDWFRISFHATYAQGPIQYTARIRLEGDDAGTLTVSMAGEAQADFLRNRIGLCVLHPLTDAGREVRISRPDGSTYASRFPESIAPHQPFKNIQEMTWALDEDVAVRLTFAGEIFETEDQRNWTDASYKTYGTPLDRPIPARVKTGDRVAQTVRLGLVGKVPARPATPAFVRLDWAASSAEVPKLGMALDAAPAGLLPRPAYLAAELRLPGITWRAALKNALARAERLGCPLVLTVWFGKNYPNEVDQFRDEVVPFRAQLKSVLLCLEGYPVTTPALLLEAETRWRQALPEVRLGYGTTDHFAELNRNRPPAALNGRGDFLSFPVNPQVHLTDSRTMLENVAALRDALSTAQSFGASRAIHIGPIGISARSAGFSDPRQDSLAGLAWTVLALGYLAGTRAVTLQDSAPARFLCQLFHDFQPVRIRPSRSAQPQVVDGVGFTNAAGAELLLLSNSTAQEQLAVLDLPARPAQVHRISAEEWQQHRDDTTLDWLKPVPESGENGVRLPAFSLTLIWVK